MAQQKKFKISTRIFTLVACGFGVLLISGCAGMFDFLDAEMNKAISKKNPKICRKMDDEARKERCLAGVAEAAKNEKLCDEINDKNTKDNCLSKVAVAADKLDLCKQIAQDNYKDTCFNQLAINRNDANLCTSISNANTVGACVSQIAENKGDINLCKTIATEYYRLDCFNRIAAKSGDPAICDNLAGKDKNACYAIIAKAQKNEAFCDQISEQSAKDVCLTDVAGIIGGNLLCGAVFIPIFIL